MHKKFVLVHHYCDTGFDSIVAFSDSRDELIEIMESHPRFGSSRHTFYLFPNIPCLDVFDDGLNTTFYNLNFIKDISLINICKNVAEYLAVGEYAMLKKSYFKASSWFEKAKNSAFFGAEIIENY